VKLSAYIFLFPVVFEAAKDLLEYDLPLDVCIKSISQFSENKTDLLIVPKLLDSVNGKISKFQKNFARFSIAFACFLWIILVFRPNTSFLMKLVKHFSKCGEISGLASKVLRVGSVPTTDKKNGW